MQIAVELIEKACKEYYEDRLGRVEEIFESEIPLLELLDVARAQRCPNCEDVGFYMWRHHRTGEPEMIQCEWCDKTPDSRFNTLNKLCEKLPEI